MKPHTQNEEHVNFTWHSEEKQRQFIKQSNFKHALLTDHMLEDLIV
jgi:hypothetical protein